MYLFTLVFLSKFIYHIREYTTDGNRATCVGGPTGSVLIQKVDRLGSRIFNRALRWFFYGFGGRKMNVLSLEQELQNNAYPGRGIVIGRSKDGKHAVTAYFIMGRSQNSRNRIFVEAEQGIRTQAFDPSKLEDPSLIIYAPVRVLGHQMIVTNGDQTDTIYDGLNDGKTFEQSLRTREYEPDAPNYTPRISGCLMIENGNYEYVLSILKSHNNEAVSCSRYTFSYDTPVAGLGRFIHTYKQDDQPLPSFEGEPKLVEINGDIDTFSTQVWESLNEENKVSLFVRYINIETGLYETRIMNKNQ